MNDRRTAPFMLAATGLTLITACVTTHRSTAPEAPIALRPPQGQVLAISAHGAGVQIYECQAAADSATFNWVLKAPEAQLRYEIGKELGKHYAGPTWEAVDGSKVVGEVLARDVGPDAAAIPWLLLRAKSTSGDGVFSIIQFVQRLHTAGGLAPSTGCGAGYVGSEVRVAYSADYYFYTGQP